MIERRRPNKEYNWRPREGPPLVEELNQGEKFVIKTAQQYYVREEIKMLRNLRGNEDKFQYRQCARERNLQVKSSSNLYKLDPFIDADGLLRVGGRL